MISLALTYTHTHTIGTKHDRKMSKEFWDYQTLKEKITNVLENLKNFKHKVRGLMYNV